MINIALLGCGIWSLNYHIPSLNLLRTQNIVCVRAVYSKSEKSAIKAKEELKPNDNIKVFFGDDLDQIMNDESIVAVVICLPIDSQPDFVRKALKAGKHILSEKPVSPCIKIGEEIISEYEQKYKQCIWGIAENYYYEPYFVEAKKKLDEGIIGDIRLVIGNSLSLMGSDSPYFSTQWRQNPNYIGGYVLDGGVHVIAALRLLIGDIECISGFQGLFKKELSPVDTIVCSFKSKTGVLGTLALSFACNNVSSPFSPHAPPLFSVVGDRGTLNVSRDKLEILFPDKDNKIQVIKPDIPRNQNLTAVQNELEIFISAIKNKSTNLLYTPRQALKDVEFIENALNK